MVYVSKVLRGEILEWNDGYVEGNVKNMMHLMAVKILFHASSVGFDEAMIYGDRTDGNSSSSADDLCVRYSRGSPSLVLEDD